MPKVDVVSSKAASFTITPRASLRALAIPPGASSLRLSWEEWVELQYVFDQMHSSGYLSYVVDDSSEGLTPEGAALIDAAAASGTARIVSLGAPAAKSATSVHAAYAGNAAVAFPGPFTNPAVPRNLRCVFAASYDGGNVTVTGTDQFDAAQTEVFTGTASSTQVGVKIFKTVTAAVRSATGATANTVSIGTGDKLGLLFQLSDGVALLAVDDVVEAVTVDATLHAVTPTTVPNGSKVYKLVANF